MVLPVNSTAGVYLNLITTFSPSIGMKRGAEVGGVEVGRSNVDIDTVEAGGSDFTMCGLEVSASRTRGRYSKALQVQNDQEDKAVPPRTLISRIMERISRTSSSFLPSRIMHLFNRHTLHHPGRLSQATAVSIVVIGVIWLAYSATQSIILSVTSHRFWPQLWIVVGSTVLTRATCSWPTLTIQCGFSLWIAAGYMGTY